MSRRPLVAANWKMHLLRHSARQLCAQLAARRAAENPGVEVVLFPGFTLLSAVAEALAGSALAWGGQDLHAQSQGAHTGDVSGAQLADVGCSWVLCGHSERRRDHGESDPQVGAKARAARQHGLKPMICLGETLEEREQGQTLEVLRRQLAAALEGRSWEPGELALAYEPVWAIGTGRTATPEIAQEAHAFLRRQLGELLGSSAEQVRILYGGSAKPDNAASLIAQKDVDGFLVGGASLDPEQFWAIIAVSGQTPAV